MSEPSPPRSSPGAWCRRHPDLTVVVALFVVTSAVFAGPLAAGRTVSPMNILGEHPPWHAVIPPGRPANPALTDIAVMFHPWLIYAGAQIHRGVFPLWNPHEYTGAPFFGNGQSALLFPITHLAVVFPAWLGVTLVSWTKLLAIGVAMYWLLRTLRVARVPAFTGACAFMLSAVVVAWLQWTVASTLIWLPVLFAATERLRERRDGRALVVLAVVVALDVFAGYPQAMAQALVVTTAWALARAPGAPRTFLPRYAVAVALGLALAAVQFVPFLEYVRESFVFAYRRQWTPMFSAPLKSATTFLLPDYFGTGKETWGAWQFAILTGYAGIVTLAVLPLGIRAAWRRGDGRFFIGLAVVAVALHYGLPGVELLTEVPGFSLGTNLRLMPLIAFALAALCALGLDAMKAGGRDRIAAWLVGAWFTLVVTLVLAAVVVDHVRPEARRLSLSLPAQYAIGLAALCLTTVVVGRAVAGRAAPHTTVRYLAVLQVASLLPLAVTYNPSVDRRSFYPAAPALDYLRREAGHDSRVVMPGSVGLVYDLFEANGYDGLAPRRLVELTGPVGTGRALTRGYIENTVALGGSEPLSPVRILTSPLLDLLAVRFVLVAPGAPPPRPGLAVVYDGGDARIFRNDAALPRARVVRGGRCVDDATAIRLIGTGTVDLRDEVLLADCGEPVAAAVSAVAPRGSARVLTESGNDLAIRVSTDAAGYLVLSDTWFPGWRATIDGVATPIWRANHAFRAVAVPAGDHQVVFRFRPGSIALGGIISVVALLAAGVIAWKRP